MAEKNDPKAEASAAATASVWPSPWVQSMDLAVNLLLLTQLLMQPMTVENRRIFIGAFSFLASVFVIGYLPRAIFWLLYREAMPNLYGNNCVKVE